MLGHTLHRCQPSLRGAAHPCSSTARPGQPPRRGSSRQRGHRTESRQRSRDQFSPERVGRYVRPLPGLARAGVGERSTLRDAGVPLLEFEPSRWLRRTRFPCKCQRRSSRPAVDDRAHPRSGCSARAPRIRPRCRRRSCRAGRAAHYATAMRSTSSWRGRDRLRAVPSRPWRPHSAGLDPPPTPALPRRPAPEGRAPQRSQRATWRPEQDAACDPDRRETRGRRAPCVPAERRAG
jgi:hypothetical protein